MVDVESLNQTVHLTDVAAVVDELVTDIRGAARRFRRNGAIVASAATSTPPCAWPWPPALSAPSVSARPMERRNEGKY